jgi:type IV pilus assembly protein PilV
MAARRNIEERPLMKTKMKNRKRQAGFTLVEAVVALVVLAVGMLGIAGLYIEGLRSSYTALARTTAVNLAADMADRIRANPAATIAYAGVGPGLNNLCVNGPADCSPAQLANDDWFWWNQDVQNRLPQGTNTAVAVAVANPTPFTTTYTIVMTWPETGQDPANPAVYTLSFTQ